MRKAAEAYQLLEMLLGMNENKNNEESTKQNLGCYLLHLFWVSKYFNCSICGGEARALGMLI